MQRQFLIWSIEHEAWWRPGHAGYTRNLGEAGVYFEESARDILKRANYPPPRVHECLVPLECVRAESGGVGVGLPYWSRGER
jgi:hypothetical protein